MRTRHQSDRAEDGNGVHLMFGEFTLCGDAWDGHLSEDDWDGGELRPTRKRTVTCPRCVDIIRECKAARIKDAP